MENNSREQLGFDWMLTGQNPTDFFAPAPSSSTFVQQPSPSPVNTFMGSSSSMRSVNNNSSNVGFVVNNGTNNNGLFPFMNKQQQKQLQPAMGTMGNNQFVVNEINPIRSIHEFSGYRYRDEYDPYSYCCNNPNKMYCVNDHLHPGFVGFDHLNGFQETPIDHNLDIDFSRLSMSSYPASSIRKYPLVDSYMGNIYPNRRVPAPVPPVNRPTNNGCHDLCCNISHNIRRDSLDINGRGGFANVILDQNPSLVIKDYANSNNNNNGSSSLSQNRLQPAKRSKFPASLKDVKGKVYSVAKNQEGCQFLQMKCEEGNSDDIEMIFNEIKDHIREFMVDASMNYLAQKLFKVCNERQMTHMVVSVISDDVNLTNICLNSHGTRAMQKLIELVTTAEQRCLIVSALRRITVTLTKNTNGHHVIQHCLKSFQVDEVQPILNVVADNCLDIATDKSGCCVLQQCVLHANGASKEQLVTEIIDNSLHLAEHPYGNYVVQHLLGMQIPDVTGNILQKLAGNFVTLALNKYASNVIEKCLKDVPDDQSAPIIREILNSSRFLDVIQNPFGNYVVQSALQTAKGPMKEIMINRIQKDYVYLHSHPHGKRVLALARNSKPRGSTHA